jgi:hypothetical protein
VLLRSVVRGLAIFGERLTVGSLGHYSRRHAERDPARHIQTILRQQQRSASRTGWTPPGEMKWSDEAARPRDIIAAAKAQGTAIMGIRAIQAGALTDRSIGSCWMTTRSCEISDAPTLRTIAHEMGISTAVLAHQYALSLDGVNTVVLGVRNRAELRDCLAAGTAGPLPRAL